MTLLSDLFERRSDGGPYNTWGSLIPQRRTGTDWTRPVAAPNADLAMAHSAVWASTTLITDLICMLPIDHLARQGDRRVPVDPPAAFLSEPSALDTPIQWRTKLILSVLLSGNGYGWITDVDADGSPRYVELLPPEMVSYQMPASGSALEPGTFKVNGEPVDLWPVGPLAHLPGYTVAGSRLGVSVLAYAASSIGLGLSAEAFGRDWFSDGAHPSSVLTNDKPVNQSEANVVKQRYVDAMSGRREPAVLGAGWAVDQISVPANESQFLETIKANVSTVARFFRVPPELIAGEAGGSLTYANIETRNLALLTFTLAPWVTRLEEFLTRLLPNGTYRPRTVGRPRTAEFVKLNTDALLRTDAQTRESILDGQLRNGSMSVNEVRALRDLEPIGEDGDRYNWPPGSTAAPAAPDDPPDDPPDPPDAPASLTRSEDGDAGASVQQESRQGWQVREWRVGGPRDED